jgi:hypothetical protein
MATGAPGTLAYALSAALVLPLALLPGLPLALGLGRRSEWDVPTVLAAAFTLQVGVVGLIALAAHYVGLSLGFVLWASLALLLGGGLAALWPLRRPALAWRPGALAIAGGCLALAVWERTWFARMADAFYHMAAVRSLLATGRPLVTDPLFGTQSNTLDATTGAWHTVLALWALGTRLDIATWLWPGAACVGAALTALAFFSLARAVCASPGAATIATAGFVLLAQAADFRWAGYPNRLSLALALVALAALTGLAVRPNLPDALLAVIAGSATVATHLAAGGMLAAAGALLLALLAAVTFARGRRGGKRAAADWRPVGAVAAGGAAIAVVSAPLLLTKAAIVGASWLPSFKQTSLAAGVLRLPGGLLADVPGHLMQASPVLAVLGMAIAIAAAVRAFRCGDPRAVAVAALAGLPLVLLGFPPITTELLHRSYYLTARIALLLPFTIFAAIAWALAELPPSRLGRYSATALLAVTALGGLAFLAISPNAWRPGPDAVWNTRGEDIRATWGSDTLARLRAEFGAGYPRVAGDTETSYYLAALEPVSVAAVTSQHTPFTFEASDGQRRRDDMGALLAVGTPEAARRAILSQYGSDYVIVPKYRPDLAAGLAQLRAESALLRPVVETRSLVLFRVAR